MVRREIRNRADRFDGNDQISIPGGITSVSNQETVEITFKPKDGFAGGNDVPLFNDDKFTCSHDGDSAVVVPEAKTASMIMVE